MDDLISRRAAIEAVEHITSSMSVCVNTDECHGMKRMQRQAVIELANLPSAEPTLCGYDIKHLMMIAEVLRKENLPPERITEVLTDIGQIVSMVRDEFVDTLRKAVENPAIEPEIVRCKDCIKREICRTSTTWAVAPKDDWYCADAERRIND